MDTRWTKLLLIAAIPLALSAPPKNGTARISTVRPSTPTPLDPPSLLTKRVTRRPFFNIAHMVNSIKEIDTYLAKGANGLEADVYFAPNATPVFMFHGYPCDCFRHCAERERVEVYLDRIRDLTTPNSFAYNPKLVILFLDLKLLRIAHSAKALAGQNLAILLMKHLYNGTTANNSPDGSTIRSVISIGHVFDYDFILGFQNELENAGKDWLFRNYIGWDVGMNDPLFVIESMWKRFETVHNIWQGDGRSNCVSPFYNLGRLSSIVKKRDANVVGFGQRNLIRKVYQWTVDLTVNIRTALRTNVDAIITNHPERLLHVMREREFDARFRMATGKDSPWDRVLVKPPKPLPVGAAAASAILSNPTLGLKLVNGAGDMLDSLTKYVGDLLRYRSPVRYLFLSTYTSKQHLKKRLQLREEEENKVEDEEDTEHGYQNELVDMTRKTTTTPRPSPAKTSQSLFGAFVEALLKRFLF